MAWPDPSFADLEVAFVPPGVARSRGEGSRAGLTFFQDDDNLVIVNVWLDDSPNHDGSAVSLFARVGGHERDLDAVWTNVGRRVSWGRPCVLRAAFDGEQILVRLHGEPVLHRRTTDLYPGTRPLAVERVGLAVNREWGDDTGTRFTGFTARRRPLG
jgi:hypothetical protein